MITLFRDPIFSTFDKVFDSTEFYNSPKTKIKKTNEEYKISICVPGLTKSDFVNPGTQMEILYPSFVLLIFVFGEL